MKYLYLFLLFTICSYTAQAQIVPYDNAARNDFLGIGGYSFSQTSFPNGVQANPYVVSGPSPQNDFSYAVSAVGGITNRVQYISTTNTNTGISIKLFGNNIRKFGCFVLPLRASNINFTTNDVIRVTATTNLGNTAIQTGGVQIGQFVGFSVVNADEYIVSIDAQFENTPSTAAFITLPSIMVGDNTPQNVALNFDGGNDYVETPSTVGNVGTNGNFTVSCWIKPDAIQPSSASNPDENDIISKWAGPGTGANNNYPFVIRYLNSTNASPNRIRVGQWDGTNFPNIVSTTPLNDGKWHHVAFVRESAIFKLYIDGVLESITVDDYASNSTDNSTPLQIGRRGNGQNYFKGEIDEVRIWNLGKTATQIADERFCKTPNSTNLQASYNFSNGVPHADNPLINQIQDAVSTNHGTLNGFAKTGDVSNFVTGQVKYVNNDAIGSNNGSSWTNAFTDLQPALTANTCNNLFDVWVARGTYKPAASNGNRFASFIIPSGMSIYGGFAGTEKSINQRNRALIQITNETTLSGDLAGNDTPFNFATNRAENSKTVVQITGSNAVVDGFTIRGTGDEDGININSDCTNALIKHNKIIDNIYGIYIDADANNATITNCIISGNEVDGINVDGATAINIKNSLIANNGDNGVDMIPSSGMKQATISNSTIARNGGYGINNSINGITSNTLKNTLIYGNASGGFTTSGGGITNTITFSLVQGQTSTANGNLVGITNPQFVSPVASGTINDLGNYRLKDSSPCINKGTDVGVSPLDLDRNPRPQGGKTDMGAYESNVNMNEIISIATGNWEAPATWNLERVPLATDKVILNNHTVTVTTNTAKAKIVEQKTSSNLRFNTGGSLQLNQ